MKVAVLGGRGFIGSAVVRSAERRGWEPVVLTRPGASTPVERVRSTREAVERLKPDVVVHAGSAAPAGLLASRVDEERELVAAIAGHGRTIVVGSAAVLNGSIPGEDGRFDEGTLPHSLSEYGELKLAQERAALGVRGTGTDVCVARLFNPIGPGMKPHLMLGRLVEQIVRRELDPSYPRVIDVGALESVRDFLHVDDAADALTALGMLEQLPDLVHVASGEGLPARYVATLALAASTAADIELREAIDSPSPSGAVSRAVGNPGRLMRLTGWMPVRTLDLAVDQALAIERARMEPGRDSRDSVAREGVVG